MIYIYIYIYGVQDALCVRERRGERESGRERLGGTRERESKRARMREGERGIGRERERVGARKRKGARRGGREG